MTRKAKVPVLRKPARIYWAPVPMRVIRRFARRVAELFEPDRIILFGSHAYGTPNADSDVDILVVVACRDPISKGVQIRMAVESPFPMDLLVRDPRMLERRLKMGDSFLMEIVTKGKVLYEKGNNRQPRYPAERTEINAVFKDQLPG